ncbi:MAG: transporter [Deltaproteobacteria bacterium]|nr:transporter [Deltaproteobacteria bacterium]
MKRPLHVLLLVFAVMLPSAVDAHHGVASVGIAGPEGPGAAIETASSLTLPRNTLFFMLKNEHASFAKYGFAEPENKEYLSFCNAAVGFGVMPWLALYFFQPYNIKHQDSLGTTSGFADTSVMLNFGFKYDEGFRLNPEKESIDELEDWHFSAFVSSSVPVGGTDLVDRRGGFWAPDMQGGFGSPSLGAGVAATKVFAGDFTYLGELSSQYFIEHEYSFTTYQFGTELRLNNALVYKAFGKGVFRTDVLAEVNLLNLMRDKEMDAAGKMKELDASGGLIAYASAGVRLYWGRVSAGFGAKKAFLSFLNEGEDQQGSEGLEDFRLMFTLSTTVGL